MKCCYNCAFCSEAYATFVDSCDIDNHIITDVYNEGTKCDNFVPTDTDVE